MKKFCFLFAVFALVSLPAVSATWDSFDANANYNFTGSGQNSNSAAVVVDCATTVREGAASMYYGQTWLNPTGAGPWRNRLYYTDTYNAPYEGASTDKYLGLWIYGDGSGISFGLLIRTGSTSSSTGTYRLTTPVAISWTGWQRVEWEYAEANTISWVPVPAAFTADPTSYTINSLWFERGAGSELSCEVFLDEGYTASTSDVQDWALY